VSGELDRSDSRDQEILSAGWAKTVGPIGEVALGERRSATCGVPLKPASRAKASISSGA
jgi:hypothetical protein